MIYGSRDVPQQHIDFSDLIALENNVCKIKAKQNIDEGHRCDRLTQRPTD
jgi:hypothetical protein